MGGPGVHLPGEWPGRHPRLAAQDGSEERDRTVRLSLRAMLSDDWPSGELSTLYTHLQRLRESYGLRRRDVVAVLAGYEDDLSTELTFITNVGGFAEILNEGDDLI